MTHFVDCVGTWHFLPNPRFLPNFIDSPPPATMFLSLLCLLISARLIVGACYDIRNNVVTTPDAVPWSNISGMCCDTNRGASSPFTPDTCLSNGLCQKVFLNESTSKPDTNYWREGCSDSGWSSQHYLTGIYASASASSVPHSLVKEIEDSL
jgi:hypothetical protein